MAASTPASQAAHPSAGRRAEPGGWVVFAGIMLFLNGCFAVLFGLGAILNDKVVTVGGTGGVVLWDITAWGWITLLIGAVMLLTGLGLFAGNTAARWLGVFFAMLHALTQFAFISAFPLWSILVISLDVVIIYQLSARWEREY
jgi:hypothetical protein